MRNIGKLSVRTFVLHASLIGLVPWASSQAQERKIPTIAVMPLSGPGLDAAASQAITDGLADELIKTGKVRVMERSQMEGILKEQGFQQSGACDGSECAVQIGKLLSIEQMIVGSVGKLGSSYSIMVRSVDVTTGEVMATSRKLQRGEIDEVVVSVLPTLAQELTGGKSSASFTANAPEIKAVSDSVPAPALRVEAISSTSAAKPSVAPSPIASRPDAAAASAANPETSPVTAPRGKNASNWGWWIAGGIAVAGGAAAAVLLSGSKSSNAATSSDVGTNNPTDNGAGWTSKVEW